jgi:hypothetical protein
MPLRRRATGKPRGVSAPRIDPGPDHRNVVDLSSRPAGLRAETQPEDVIHRPPRPQAPRIPRCSGAAARRTRPPARHATAPALEVHWLRGDTTTARAEATGCRLLP